MPNDCEVCNGTGEGDHDGGNCWACGGAGTTRAEPDPDFAYDEARA